jgi:hypothetical protein
MEYQRLVGASTRQENASRTAKGGKTRKTCAHQIGDNRDNRLGFYHHPPASPGPRRSKRPEGYVQTWLLLDTFSVDRPPQAGQTALSTRLAALQGISGKSQGDPDSRGGNHKIISTARPALLSTKKPQCAYDPTELQPDHAAEGRTSPWTADYIDVCYMPTVQVPAHITLHEPRTQHCNSENGGL